MQDLSVSKFIARVGRPFLAAGHLSRWPFVFNPKVESSLHFSRYTAAMDHMFLPDVESHKGDDNYSRAIEVMKRAGSQYPQILHMFSYKIHATVHLERFTQEILREPAPLSPGFRELIAAYTSHLNQCPF